MTPGINDFGKTYLNLSDDNLLHILHLFCNPVLSGLNTTVSLNDGAAFFFKETKI